MGHFLNRPNRIQYDALRGMWHVIFGSKVVKQEFKNSMLAYEFLQRLEHDTLKPEY